MRIADEAGEGLNEGIARIRMNDARIAEVVAQKLGEPNQQLGNNGEGIQYVKMKDRK